MSWFKKALTISTPVPGGYYTVVDPGEFYEWRFKMSIPKGTIFTKHLPQSDVFTKGFVIASAKLNPDNLISKDSTFILKNDDKSEVFLEIGQIQSPTEILAKLKSLQEKYSTSLDNFRKTLGVRKYIISQSQKPCLYKINSSDNDIIEVENYGEIKNISEKLSQIEKDIRFNPTKKTGRAYEMEKVRKFLNAKLVLDNHSLPVDSTKLETIVCFAELKPSSKYNLSVSDCLSNISDDIKDLVQLINNYQKLSWIKSSLSS